MPFADVARALGGFGDDVAQGQTIADQLAQQRAQAAQQAASAKLRDLMTGLQLQELRRKLGQSSVTPQGVQNLPGGGLAGITFDPSKGTYGQQTVIPGGPVAQPVPKTDFEMWRAQNPNATVADWMKLQQQYRGSDKPPNEAVKDPFQLWQAQNPTKPVSEWLKMQENYRRTGATADNVDALAYDVAAGKAAMPTGKFGSTVATRMKQLGIEPPQRSVKAVPPDVQNLLASPVPEKPSADQSRRLADAADRIFGGSAYKQDLMGRGKRTSFPFVGTFGRDPYVSVAYDKAEYNDILDSVRQATSTDSVPTGFSEVVK